MPADIFPAYDAWRRAVPRRYEGQVVRPRAFRLHEDEEALATKLIGVDEGDRRCWVQHDHTLVEERFDIDELPLEVVVRHERRSAFRLHSGRWLLQVDRIERLDSCSPRVVNQPAVVVEEAALGL